MTTQDPLPVNYERALDAHRRALKSKDSKYARAMGEVERLKRAYDSIAVMRERAIQRLDAVIEERDALDDELTRLGLAHIESLETIRRIQVLHADDGRGYCEVDPCDEWPCDTARAIAGGIA